MEQLLYSKFRGNSFSKYGLLQELDMSGDHMCHMRIKRVGVTLHPAGLSFYAADNSWTGSCDGFLYRNIMMKIKKSLLYVIQVMSCGEVVTAKTKPKNKKPVFKQFSKPLSLFM